MRLDTHQWLATALLETRHHRDHMDASSPLPRGNATPFGSMTVKVVTSSLMSQSASLASSTNPSSGSAIPRVSSPYLATARLTISTHRPGPRSLHGPFTVARIPGASPWRAMACSSQPPPAPRCHSGTLPRTGKLGLSSNIHTTSRPWQARQLPCGMSVMSFPHHIMKM